MKRNEPHMPKAPYSVKDEFNNQLFTTYPTFFSFSNRQILIDTQNEILGNTNAGHLRIKRNSFLQETYYLGTMKDVKKFKLCLKEFSTSNKFHASVFVKNDKNTPLGKISGDWEKMKYQIKLKRRLAASVFPTSSDTRFNKLISNDTYCIVIEEGMDYAFIMLLVISLEQIFFGQNPV